MLGDTLLCLYGDTTQTCFVVLYIVIGPLGSDTFGLQTLIISVVADEKEQLESIEFEYLTRFAGTCPSICFL